MLQSQLKNFDSINFESHKNQLEELSLYFLV